MQTLPKAQRYECLFLPKMLNKQLWTSWQQSVTIVHFIAFNITFLNININVRGRHQQVSVWHICQPKSHNWKRTVTGVCNTVAHHKILSISGKEALMQILKYHIHLAFSDCDSDDVIICACEIKLYLANLIIHSTKLNCFWKSLKCSKAQACHWFNWDINYLSQLVLLSWTWAYVKNTTVQNAIMNNHQLCNETTSHSCLPCWHLNFKDFPFRFIWNVVMV